MATLVRARDGSNFPRYTVTEEVEWVVSAVNDAVRSQQKFVVLTKEDGTKVGVIAANVIGIDAAESES